MATIDKMEHVRIVEREARALAEALRDAAEAGVGQALLLPALVSVFRDAGMLPQNLAELGVPGLR